MSRRRVTVTKRSLQNEDDPRALHAALTPGERLALVWELTKTAWALRERTDVEPRLQRSVVSVRRLRG